MKHEFVDVRYIIKLQFSLRLLLSHRCSGVVMAKVKTCLTVSDSPISPLDIIFLSTHNVSFRVSVSVCFYRHTNSIIFYPQTFEFIDEHTFFRAGLDELFHQVSHDTFMYVRTH